MVPIPEYFPSLDKCLNGEELLMQVPALLVLGKLLIIVQLMEDGVLCDFEFGPFSGNPQFLLRQHSSRAIIEPF